MKNYYLALMVSALLTINVYAEDVEEVIVTASLTNQTVSDLKDPLHVVATRESGSDFRHSSSIASEIWSQILSGCPSETDSDVKI